MENRREEIIREIVARKMVEDKVDICIFKFNTYVDETIRQDLIQIVLLNLAKSPNLERYWDQGQTNFEKVLYFITKSEFVEHPHWRPFLIKVKQFGAVSRNNVLRTEEGEEPQMPDFPQEESPLDRFRELMGDIRRVLPEDDYKLVEAYYANSCQYTKTARELGRTKSEVKRRLQSAFERIRAQVER